MVMDIPLRYAASRRGRGPINQASASCLVDGCNSDLSKCRDYHRRHKVCEIHSKTPKVTIRGQEQRFCQQCSRFHSLVEFDDVKRSCRKRLDGHNRRRRKPQLPESSILLHSTAQFLSDFHGASKFVEPTGTGPPQVFPTASCSFSTDFFFSRSHFDLGNKKAPSSSYMPLSVSHSLSWDQVQFPFLQGNTHQEPLPNSSTAQGMRMNGGGCSQDMLLGTVSSESSSNGRALSLLSSLPPHTEASPLPTQNQTMLVSDQREEDMFFQIRHDGSSLLHLHHHHTPSAWEE